MKALMMTAALAALGGCAMSQADEAPSGGRHAAGHFKAEAVLRDAGGADVGKASVQQADGGLRATIDVTGMPAGMHGVHVHMTGKCEGPDFASAGGHWNPNAHQHGTQNPMGPHGGDLPNLEVGADGRGRLTFMLPAGGTYEGLLDEDGAAVVVHAKADDLKTDPSGNSGGRVACGVLGAV
jgi:Cu-Zn family superoxide dismutase